MFVSKTLVAADASTIVNEWVGEVAGKHTARGIEVWELDARPESSLVQDLRMLVAHPLTAEAEATPDAKAEAALDAKPDAAPDAKS